MGKRENLEGKVFTRWTVIKDTGEQKVLCRCECGTEKWVKRDNLKRGVSRSCGCLRKEEFHKRFTKDLSGRKFGRLLVLEEAGTRNGRTWWKTQCECGTIKVVSSNMLLTGKTLSCGCLKRDKTIERCTKPMIGKTFGRLTVLEKMYAKKGKGAYYKCQWSCGSIVIVQ